MAILGYAWSTTPRLTELEGGVEGRLDERVEHERVKSAKEAESVKRTIKRRLAKGRSIVGGSDQMSEPKLVEHKGRAKKEKEVEKSWAEIAKGHIEDKSETTKLVNNVD